MKHALSILLAALLLGAPSVAAAGEGGASVRAEGTGQVLLAKRTRRRRPRRRRAKPKPAPQKAEETKSETAEAAQDEGGAPSAGSALRRSNRMEFDARLVQGQTAQSGAVYLFQRAPRRLPPLLELKQSYLDRIVEPVLGDEEAKEKR